MKFKPVSVPLGGILLFSVFLVHRTRRPGHSRRVAFSHRIEDASDPTFIDRGYYSAQTRTIKREIAWAPTRDQVRAVFA